MYGQHSDLLWGAKLGFRTSMDRFKTRLMKQNYHAGASMSPKKLQVQGREDDIAQQPAVERDERSEDSSCMTQKTNPTSAQSSVNLGASAVRENPEEVSVHQSQSAGAVDNSPEAVTAGLFGQVVAIIDPNFTPDDMLRCLQILFS